jgi:hypothetical protein
MVIDQQALQQLRHAVERPLLRFHTCLIGAVNNCSTEMASGSQLQTNTAENCTQLAASAVIIGNCLILHCVPSDCVCAQYLQVH